MEFHEKLQELRKNTGLTQEELAEALFVSRAAISKWESGRGYPNIDSLKEISRYFSISIDDLLSSEKLLSIAEKEHTSNIRNICDLLFGIVDMCSVLLIILPLYPNTINGYIYSVNLFAYVETTMFCRILYWILFAALFICGVLKLVIIKKADKRLNNAINGASVFLGALTVLLLALTRQSYAVVFAFLLLLVKGALVLKREKA